MTIKKHNRIKKTEPQLGKYYCYSCDHALVTKGGKCPYCGKRDVSKHKRK